MKNYFIVVLLILVIFSQFLAVAFAVDVHNFADIYMVSAQGNTTEKTTPFIFGQDQPWLFLRFSNDYGTDAVIGSSSTLAVWNSPNDSINPPPIVFYNTTQNGVWGSLDDWFSTSERVGNWTIGVNTPFTADQGISVPSGIYTGTANFSVSSVNVVPEPASCLLYLLGAAPFGVGLFRRKKK